MHIDYKENVEEINFNNNSLSLEEQAILNIIKNNSEIKQEEMEKEMENGL